MYRPRIIPCLLLQNKGLVKTIRFSVPTYVGDPINAVKIFNDNCMFVDQYHISVTVERQFNDCCEIKYLNDLTDPETELFQGKLGETDYVKAICKLKNHFSYIQAHLCGMNC